MQDLEQVYKNLDDAKRIDTKDKVMPYDYQRNERPANGLLNRLNKIGRNRYDQNENYGYGEDDRNIFSGYFKPPKSYEKQCQWFSEQKPYSSDIEVS